MGSQDGALLFCGLSAISVPSTVHGNRVDGPQAGACYELPFSSFLFFFFFKKLVYFYISYAMVFCLSICLYEGVGYPGTRGTDSCELPLGCSKLNPGLLEEQSVLLTIEPSLQPPLSPPPFLRQGFSVALPVLKLTL